MLYISFDYFIMESAALINSFNLPTFYLYYNISFVKNIKFSTFYKNYLDNDGYQGPYSQQESYS